MAASKWRIEMLLFIPLAIHGTEPQNNEDGKEQVHRTSAAVLVVSALVPCTPPLPSSLFCALFRLLLKREPTRPHSHSSNSFYSEANTVACIPA
uniref:Putative secreted protein n=1 Tax=Ixodes ricinus TaxID=34613 RepID=A0A6B0UCK6_IXORI